MVFELQLERSPEARIIAEEALLRLLLALNGRQFDLVVLGGLVPEVLTRGQVEEVPSHIGTTDVDIHVTFVPGPADSFSLLEQALEAAGAKPQTTSNDGWRWIMFVQGFPVKVEFLCDREDTPANSAIVLPGCARLAAANLRGTGFVARDWTEEKITRKIDGQTVTYAVRFAGLEGYLMAKLFAARYRGADRDYYDLVYVLIYNRVGGPSEVAELLRTGSFAEDVRNSHHIFREIEARFATVGGFGPQSYVAQSLQVQPEADRFQLAQNAIGAVSEFVSALQLDSNASRP